LWQFGAFWVGHNSPNSALHADMRAITLKSRSSPQC